MSSAASLQFNDSYKLIQSTYIYRGECKICFEADKEIFSLHQIPSEIYSEKEHGLIQMFGHLQGVMKDTEIAEYTEDKTKAVCIPILHQVSLCTDGLIRVFSPMHGACNKCIISLKKMDKIRCHICRLDLSVEKYIWDMHSFPALCPSRFETSSRLESTRQSLSYAAVARASRDLLDDGPDFRGLSLSERREEQPATHPFTSLLESGSAMVQARFSSPYLRNPIMSLREEIETLELDADTARIVSAFVAEEGVNPSEFLQSQRNLMGDEIGSFDEEVSIPARSAVQADIEPLLFMQSLRNKQRKSRREKVKDSSHNYSQIKSAFQKDPYYKAIEDSPFFEKLCKNFKEIIFLSKHGISLKTLFDNDESILESYLKSSPLTHKERIFSIIEEYHPTGLLSMIYKEAFLLVRDTPLISQEQLNIRWGDIQTYLSSLPVEASCKISQIFYEKSKITPSEPSFRLFMIHPDIFFNAIFCFINIHTLKCIQEGLFTFTSDIKDPYLLSLKMAEKIDM